ncbi:hypothetical protein [Nocardia testacea]|uniref:hypothetical protein n=1 Tax=Nocardia testacea TaxID=248551 RepID=UPI0033D2BE77
MPPRAARRAIARCEVQGGLLCTATNYRWQGSDTQHRTRTIRSTGPDGEVVETTVERDTAADVLMTVRSFYVDLAQWAFDDPARWGRWALPCPIRADDTQYRKMTSRRKARMDQRTRERLPVLPMLIEAVDRERRNVALRLELAAKTAPGEVFTVDGVTLRRSRLARPSPRPWAEDLAGGTRATSPVTKTGHSGHGQQSRYCG